MINLNKDPERNQFIILLFLCIVFAVLPFFVVRFIPATDLPQHLAQMRLLEDILKNPQQEEYSINLSGANTLVYLLVGLNWISFEPVLAGKAVVLELVLAWLVSIFILAKRKQRSITTAAITCIFIFNVSLYWGFLNFLIGWPIFIVWYVYVIDSQYKQSRTKEFIIIFFTSFLLFYAHALWLLTALVLLALGNILRKRNIRHWWLHFLSLLPVGIWSAFWFPRFAAARGRLDFDTAPYWHISPFERLHPHWLLDSILGGLRGPAEAFLCVGIILWIIVILKTNWGHNRERSEKEFFLAGVFFTLIVLLAPEEFMNTVFFAQRWGPIAMIFFLLSLPPPRIPEALRFASAILFLSILSFTTCYNWYQYERIENFGLEESLNLITEGSKVIGLDFVHDSEYICGFPFLQTFAYAQVLHGGDLNFSFTEHHSGIVSLAYAKKKRRWTEGLEWFPENVQPEDMRQFDYAIINGTEYLHAFFATKPEIHPLMSEGRWRLYRCIKDSIAH